MRLERRVREVILRGVFRCDQRRIQDVSPVHRKFRDEMERGDLDRICDHARSVNDIDRNQSVLVLDTFDDIFHSAATDDKHLLLSFGLPQRVQYAQRDVVILRPDRIYFREARQKILHHLESVVTIPVSVLRIQYYDLRVFDQAHEGIEALVVDHGWQTAQNNDVPFPAESFYQVLCSDFAHPWVVTGYIQVLNVVIRQSAIDDGYEYPFLFHFANRVGERR